MSSAVGKLGIIEDLEYHHPDRLGTKLVSDPVGGTFKEQATLPFGTSIDSETSGVSGSGSSGTGAPSNQRFTSYDRSEDTGLDYAVNRTYNSGQSRFTTVDPIGMASASIGDPQSLNLFAYVTNNPVDFVDPSGLDGCIYGVGSDGLPWSRCTVDVSVGDNTNGGGIPFNDTPLTEQGQNDCERFLAEQFTNTADGTFTDTMDGEPRDTFTGLGADPFIAFKAYGYMETHNHYYNPSNNPYRPTDVYAPPGGQVLFGGRIKTRTGNQSAVTVFYKELGGEKNVVLQFFHVENYDGKTTLSDGRVRLGTLGEEGTYTSRQFAGGNGWHIHINAFKWWGDLDKNGNPILKRKTRNENGMFPSVKWRTPGNTLGLGDLLCPKAADETSV